MDQGKPECSCIGYLTILGVGSNQGSFLYEGIILRHVAVDLDEGRLIFDLPRPAQPLRLEMRLWVPSKARIEATPQIARGESGIFGIGLTSRSPMVRL